VDTYCGWCDGTLFINNEAIAGNCINPSEGGQWSCDGLFKSSSECDCSGTGAPSDLTNLGVWRGFQINDPDKISYEVNFQVFPHF
jgi:hypothetical protein